MWDTVNPSMGPDSPTDFTASDYTSDEMALNADFVYSMPVSAFAGPLVFNFGGEYRREGFKIGAGEPNSSSGGGWARSKGRSGGQNGVSKCKTRGSTSNKK